MAFEKPVDQGNGVVAGYHAVKSVFVDYSANPPVASVELSSFVDASEAAKGFDKAVNVNSFGFDASDIKAGTDPLVAVNAKIAARDEWADAQVVAEPSLKVQADVEAADAQAEVSVK